MKSLLTILSTHITFIIAVLFVGIACYLIYMKCYSVNGIQEGMGQGRLRDIIRKIAVAKHPNATDVNKLTAIQNVLLVSSDKFPTQEDIDSKRSMMELAQLSNEEQASKLKSLLDTVEKIYPQLREVYPQFDIAFWKNLFETNLKQGNLATSTSKLAKIKYTFNEQIFSIINNKNIENAEKIKLIVKITKPRRVNVAKAGKKIGNQIRGRLSRFRGRLSRFFGGRRKKSRR